MGISVSGGSQVRAALGRIDGQVRRQLARAVQDEAEDVRADAQANVPVLSGDLQAGIESRSRGELAASVGVYDESLIYAIWIEWGRSSAAAQPFATPAAEQSRQRWPRRAGDAVKAAAKG